MKTFDFISESKIKQLQDFCAKRNPAIELSIVHNQVKDGKVRIIASSDLKGINDFDEALYLLENGVARPNCVTIEKPKKKWYQFFSD